MKTTLANTEQIPEGDLRPLWFDGYYDGVLSGFLTWQDRLFYFSICDDSNEEARCFSVHYLTDEEAKAARRDYDAFRSCFGDHCDLLRHPKAGARSPTDEERARYEASRKQPEVHYEQNRIIGWFRSSHL